MASVEKFNDHCWKDRAELTHKVNLFDLHHKYVDSCILTRWSRISTRCGWTARPSDVV